MIDAVHTAVVGSARICRVFDAGSDREDRSLDVFNVCDTWLSVSEKGDDRIFHSHSSSLMYRVTSQRKYIHFVFFVCGYIHKINLLWTKTTREEEEGSRERRQLHSRAGRKTAPPTIKEGT